MPAISLVSVLHPASLPLHCSLTQVGLGKYLWKKKHLLLHPLRSVEFLQLEKGNPRELPVPSFCCSPWRLILATCTPISYLNPKCVLRCPSDHRGPEAVQAGEIPAEKGFANNASSANTTWLSSAALTESGTQILLTD